LDQPFWVILGVLAILASSACGSPEAQTPAPQASPEPAQEDISKKGVPTLRDGVIYLPPAWTKQMNIRTQAVGQTTVSPVVHVTGVLEYDEQRIAAIGSRISGRVLDVHVVEGTAVEPGTPLATVESAKLGSVQADLRAIEARSRVAKLNKNRKRQLVSEGIASKRSAEVANREHAVAKAELQAARQRLRALGGKVKGSEVGQLDLYSPIAGEVVNVSIYRGQAVDPMDTAFTVVDNSQLWVRLAVFEGEIDAISVGDAVEIRAQADPEGVLLTGMVDYVSSMFDPQSHAAQVRVIVPNDDGYLRVGQAVNAVIHAQRAEKEGLSVPREAIVQVDGNPTVFVAETETTVIPRAIEIGISGPDRIEVTAGLAAGDVVVTDGVFALKSELFR